MKKRLIIITSVLLVICLGLMIAVFIKGEPSYKEGNSLEEIPSFKSIVDEHNKNMPDVVEY